MSLRHLAFGLLAALGLFLLFGGLMVRHSAFMPNFADLFMAPNWASGYWLGTDAIGRDLYVRLLGAARVSVLFALGGAALAAVLGSLVGLLAAELGGWIDQALMRSVDVLSAIPMTLLMVVLAALLGSGLLTLLLAVAAASWLELARIVRAEALRIRAMPYYLAGLAAGLDRTARLRRLLLPNILPLVAAYGLLLVPKVVLLESFLSYLGIGLAEPHASLGGLISDGVNDMQQAPWLLLAPIAVLMSLLVALAILSQKRQA
jgi:oligopeptide transport system permease protein